MRINSFEEIIEHSLAFVNDDFTELWVICDKIYDTNPEIKYLELIETTKTILRELIEKHNVCLLNETTLKPMILSVDETLKLVENHLLKLNKAPNIGDGIWLTIKE